jgi:hypothetical protein
MERREFLGALTTASFGAVIEGSLKEFSRTQKTPREPLQICLGELP